MRTPSMAELGGRVYASGGLVRYGGLGASIVVEGEA